MPITIDRPCGKRLQVAEAQLGRQGSCPVCGRILELSAATASTAAPSDAITARPSAGTTAAPSAVLLEPWDGGATALLAAPSYKLFSAGDVALATFFSNALGGRMVMAWNHWVLGQRWGALWALVLGTGVTAAHLAFAFSLPDRSKVWMPVSLALVFIMYCVARYVQGRSYDRHIRQGGRKRTGWAAAGIGLLCSLVLIVGIIGYFAIVGDEYPSVAISPIETMYYGGKATQADARQLGAALQEVDHFDGSGAADVLLLREGDVWIVSVTVQKGAWNKADVIAYYRTLRAKLREQAFPGQRVEFRLCDDDWKPKKTIRD